IDFHAVDNAGSILLDNVSVVATSTTGQPPTVTTAASAKLNASGKTAALSVAATDPQSQALTYAWSTLGTPPAGGAFSANGTGAANNTTASFSQAGTYSFLVTITDTGGLSAASSVTLIVSQLATSLVVSPNSASVPVNGTRQFTATALDQFGAALSMQPSFAW